MISNEAIQDISDWLIEQGLAGAEFEAIVGGYCDRLVAAGVALWRGHVGMRTLHPSIESITATWRRGVGIESAAIDRELVGSAGWLQSPLKYMIDSGTMVLRQRLESADGEFRFPLFDELRDLGATDYTGRMLAFRLAAVEDRPTGIIFSWTTDRPGGFSDAELSALRRLEPRLALSLKTILAEQIAVNVLDTYVGGLVGRRVLSGDITRGNMDTIPAVILFADLRGFTAMADQMPGDDLGEMLNQYFDCMVEPVFVHGGQVLKFLGDGLLAAFEVTDTSCGAALDAAMESLRAVDALNGRREAAGAPITTLDIALHLGDVLFGNVGAKERLDFTVIGPAVNEASRIETLCGTLGHHLLISETFAKAAVDRADQLKPLGRHALRGVRGDRALFTVEAPQN